MKKLLIFGLLILNLNSFGQITKVNLGSTAGDGTGDPLRTAFGKVNTTIDSVNAHSSMLILKAPKANPVFTGVAVLNSMRVGGLGKVLIDSISSDGSNIRFWRGATELTAVPGVGGAAWGSITGTLTDQVDLKNALDAKAPLASPAFTGTPTGITAAHVGAMSTSHAANAITGTNISNWNTAYGWGNHAGLYVPIGDLSGYVPTSRTVNGYALSSNVTLSASDVGLGSVTNESKATMFTSPTFTGTPTVPGYVPTTRTVNGHFLSSNVSVTASDVGLGNVTNESKATMFTSPTFTGTVSGITYSMVGAAAASHTQGQSTITALSDSLLARYTKTQANAKLNLKVNIADTANMLDTYINTTELNDMTDDLSSYAVMKADSTVKDGGYASRYELDKLKTGVFNILDYGAISDDGLEDQTAIQAAINAASAIDVHDYGAAGTVIIPAGEWYITDSIVLRNYVSIKAAIGAKFLVPANYKKSIWYASGELYNCNIDGGYYGSSSSDRTWTCIKLTHTGSIATFSMFNRFQNMYIENPNIGIYIKVDNDGWVNGNTFSNITIWRPLSGIKTRVGSGGAVADLSNNTFNNISVQVLGNTSLGAIDSLDGAYNSFLSFHAYDVSGTTRNTVLTAKSVKNYFIASEVGSLGTTFKNHGDNNFIQNSDGDLMMGYGNKIGFYNDAVTLTHGGGTLTVDAAYGFVTAAGTPEVYTPLSSGNITAVGGIGDELHSGILYYNGNSAIDISANPQIQDAVKNGTKMTIIGSSDTNTLTLDDGTGLALSGQCVLGIGDTITLIYSSTLDLWVEVSRSNN